MAYRCKASLVGEHCLTSRPLHSLIAAPRSKANEMLDQCYHQHTKPSASIAGRACVRNTYTSVFQMSISHCSAPYIQLKRLVRADMLKASKPIHSPTKNIFSSKPPVLNTHPRKTARIPPHRWYRRSEDSFLISHPQEFRMSTLGQIKANRLNSQKSSGPRSDTGKPHPE